MSEQKSCFFVSPIGPRGSDIRARADRILRHIVRPTCDESGYAVFRADELDGPGMITRRVIRQLLDADLVIADLSGHNANVFYELGVRHATGLPTIQLCQDGEHLPFDVSDYTTVFFDYKDLDSAFDGREQLKKYIRALSQMPHVENPITSVVGTQGQFLAAAVHTTLASKFDALASQILCEISRLRVDKDVLFETLSKTRPAPDKLPSVEVDPSGLWLSNIGPVSLYVDDERVFGKYQLFIDLTEAELEAKCKSTPVIWTGEISGRYVDNKRLIVYHWIWFNGMHEGVGFWKVLENEIWGGWFYAYEMPEYSQVVNDPHFLLSAPLPSEREWRFLRRLLDAGLVGEGACI